MLALERSLHKTLPVGPEEGQLFYIQMQVATGLRPPPYPWQVNMRYILVLQWPNSSESDYDALIEMEDQLESALGDHSSVDGYDFGSGEMNIFVETDDPAVAFADIAVALRGSPRWADLRAAYRAATGEGYEILWPQTLREFSVK